MRKIGKIKKKALAVLAVVGLLTGSMSVFAAPDESNGVLCDDGYIEYTEEFDADEDWDDMVYVGTIHVDRTMGDIDYWEIAANDYATSGIFYASSGGTIGISVVASPSTSEIRVGIVQPSSSIRYVTGSGSITHDFALTQSGNYKLYIKNTSNVAVTVAGFFTY